MKPDEPNGGGEPYAAETLTVGANRGKVYSAVARDDK